MASSPELLTERIDRKAEVVDQLVWIGSDADRKAHAGPAISWYVDDPGAEQWWDIVDDTWTKREGSSYTPAPLSTVTNAQHSAIWASVPWGKISAGTLDSADVDTWRSETITLASAEHVHVITGRFRAAGAIQVADLGSMTIRRSGDAPADTSTNDVTIVSASILVYENFVRQGIV